MIRLCLSSIAVFSVLAGSLAGCNRPDDRDYVIPDLLEIEVVGRDFQWEVRYPGPDGVLGTEDDRIGARDVHVPVGARAKLHLRSRDYIYFLALPHLGLKEIAVPELEYALEFDAGAAGRYELLGDQMCGYTHPGLLGELIVESREDFVSALQKMGR